MSKVPAFKREYKKQDRCKYCGGTENLTVDHKHPKILGGTDEKNNLQTLCGYCNLLKSGIPHETFKKIMEHGVYCFINKYQSKYMSTKENEDFLETAKEAEMEAGLTLLAVRKAMENSESAEEAEG